MLVAMSENMMYLTICGLITGAVLLILLPWLIAGKDHPHRNELLILSILVGWTFVGWMVLMMYVLLGPKTDGKVAKLCRHCGAVVRVKPSEQIGRCVQCRHVVFLVCPGHAVK